MEAVPEAGNLTNRLEQVTLFRAHRHLVPPLSHPYRYVFKQGHNEVSVRSGSRVACADRAQC